MSAFRFEMSIEVLDGAFPASAWKNAYRDTLVQAALSSGAVDWHWHEHSWGIVLELAFRDESAWEVFAGLSAVRAALDAAPNGLVVKRGWGGTSGSWEPRRPKPAAGSGAAELPVPCERPPVVFACAS